MISNNMAKQQLFHYSCNICQIIQISRLIRAPLEPNCREHLYLLLAVLHVLKGIIEGTSLVGLSSGFMKVSTQKPRADEKFQSGPE